MTYEAEKCVMGYIFDRTLPSAVSESIRQFALRCSVQDLRFSRQEVQGLGVNQSWRARLGDDSRFEPTKSRGDKQHAKSPQSVHLVDCKEGTPVVVERKKRILGNIPSEPWENHKLQLAIYMLSLERIGLNPEFGVLEYVKPATSESRRYFISDI